MRRFLQRLVPYLTAFLLAMSTRPVARAQQVPAPIRLLPEDAERGLNGPQHNFDFLPSGASDGQYQTAGFFGQKLRPYLADNPDALAHLNDYRRQKTLFLIDRLAAVGAMGVYGLQIFIHGERQYDNPVQRVAIGVFTSSVLATIFINRNTNTHLLRAVAAYNAGPGLGGAWRRPTMGVAVSPTGRPLLVLRWALR